MSHKKTRPAISKSELVIVPFGLFSVCSCRFTSSGHSNRKTVGTTSSVMPKMTPPTPSPEASTIPAMLGSPRTSWRTWVGVFRDSLKIDRQSLRAMVNALFWRNHTVFGFWAMTLLNGVNKPFDPGTPHDACLILPNIFSYWLNGMPLFDRKASLVRVMSLSYFPSSSCTVLSFPCSSHPKMSLRTAHAPSRFFNFLSDSGSFSGSSGLAGKISWMA
mmetsp:Transcript_6117/g.13830  ORF Transcript_6117/g.13830 Transcript_6117/m.13830 type:complete len:217 (+) Transcript_6117:334-984(+)